MGLGDSPPPLFLRGFVTFGTVILPKKNLYICKGENEAGVICDLFFNLWGIFFPCANVQNFRFLLNNFC